MGVADSLMYQPRKYLFSLKKRVARAASCGHGHALCVHGSCMHRVAMARASCVHGHASCVHGSCMHRVFMAMHRVSMARACIVWPWLVHRVAMAMQVIPWCC